MSKRRLAPESIQLSHHPTQQPGVRDVTMPHRLTTHRTAPFHTHSLLDAARTCGHIQTKC